MAKMHLLNWKPRGRSGFERSGESYLELADVFILNPSHNRKLVKRLLADPAWVNTCEEPDLMIFVRSNSKYMNRKDETP